MLARVKKILGVYRQHGLIGVARVFRTKIREIVMLRRIAAAARRQSEIESLDKARALADGVNYVYLMAVEGDVAEFGTMTGRSAVALAASVAVNNERHRNDVRGKKRAWFFDSFEGLPEARFEIDAKSHHVSTGLWAPGKCKGLDEGRFARLVARYLPRSDFTVLKGWFKDTVPKVDPAARFAMVHVDGDLYESAIDVLFNLFERKLVAKGAIIFFDDWDCNAADPEAGERRAWNEAVSRFNIRYSDQGPYSTSCHRFIVHGYGT